jgi:hypothetical protein
MGQCNLSTKALRNLKREHGTVQVSEQRLKKDYANEKLRENMGQSESKERDFKK